ncbi:MAG: hypothetical protein P8P74_13675 [Crocinitomicaceae bacterium]|nr:hypothetical protein [Crocinitomicaceae bacterium]
MTQFTFPNIMAAVILKPETFAGGATREQILAFIAGLELKMMKEERFSVNAGNLLTNHHKIEADQRGWVGQIEDFSRKKGFEWISGLKQIGIEVVLNEMNEHQREQYATFIRQFIVKLISELKPGSNKFDSAWIDQWLGIVLLHTAWGQNMWNTKELDLIEQIDEEIKKINVLYYETPGISVDLDILRYQFMELNSEAKAVS